MTVNIHSLMHPSPINAIEWAIGVLIFALIVEGIILYLATKSLYGLKVRHFGVSHRRRPPAVAVLLGGQPAWELSSWLDSLEPLHGDAGGTAWIPHGRRTAGSRRRMAYRTQ